MDIDLKIGRNTGKSDKIADMILMKSIKLLKQIWFEQNQLNLIISTANNNTIKNNMEFINSVLTLGLWNELKKSVRKKSNISAQDLIKISQEILQKYINQKMDLFEKQYF